MVVTLDIGNPVNIHPANKKDVGYRLAGLALANDYGKKIIASGPLFKDIKKAKGKLLVEFDFVGSGLMCPDQVLTGFEIAGADKVYVNAQAMITDNMVEVSHPKVNAPEYIRYAWRDDSPATLFNIEGLPASSFSSE
jgi:sialate O-acetylesterase